MWKDDASLLDMLNGARKLVARYAPIGWDQFTTDLDRQDGACFVICTIGEAATRVSEEFREAHPEVPWPKVIGARNVIIHGYDKVKLERVWDIISVAAPELIATLEPLLPGREQFD
jgi:uncharacterized protein with HEPN domain